jgi:hypothetical protein
MVEYSNGIDADNFSWCNLQTRINFYLIKISYILAAQRFTSPKYFKNCPSRYETVKYIVGLQKIMS